MIGREKMDQNLEEKQENIGIKGQAKDQKANISTNHEEHDLKKTLTRWWCRMKLTFSSSSLSYTPTSYRNLLFESDRTAQEEQDSISWIRLIPNSEKKKKKIHDFLTSNINVRLKRRKKEKKRKPEFTRIGLLDGLEFLLSFFLEAWVPWSWTTIRVPSLFQQTKHVSYNNVLQTHTIPGKLFPNPTKYNSFPSLFFFFFWFFRNCKNMTK